MIWQQLLDDIERLCPGWTRDQVGPFRYLESGYSNRNYRFRHENDEYVIRVPGAGTSYTDRRREACFYRTFGPPVTAEVIAFDEASGVMISRWVAGTLLADYRPQPSELVGYLANLHQSLAQSDPPELAGLDRTYDPMRIAREFLAQGTAHAERWIIDLAETLDWKPASITPCHNDLNPWNVISAPGASWVTLDWEWAGNNDPIFDLAALHQGQGLDFSTLPSMASQLLGGPADPGRIASCITVFWLREYGWSCAELATGNDRPEIRAQAAIGKTKLETIRHLGARILQKSP